MNALLATLGCTGTSSITIAPRGTTTRRSGLFFQPLPVVQTMATSPSVDILTCPRCGERDTQSVKIAKAMGTSRTRALSRTTSFGGVVLGAARSGSVFGSVAETATAGITTSGFADMLEPPGPPQYWLVRRRVIERMKALRSTGQWRAISDYFTQRFGLVLVNRERVQQLALSEHKRLGRLYELLLRNWPRAMVCLRCGEIYDPYLFDEIREEGRRLYEAGDLKTGSAEVDSLLNDFDERARNFEARAARGEDVSDVSGFGERLKAALGGAKELARSVNTGRLSPVALTRMNLILNRALAAMMTGLGHEYEQRSALVARCLEQATLAAAQRAPLFLKIDTAGAIVRAAVQETHDALALRGMIESVPTDLSAFERAGRILEEVVMVKPVAVVFQPLVSRREVRGATRH